MRPTITILYFASLRETLGEDQQITDLPEHVNTVAELAEHLANTGTEAWRILCDSNQVLVAVNQEIVSREHVLTGGEEIAFFPPVTGG